MRALLAVVVVAVGVAFVVSEAAMRPSTSERLVLYGLFSGTAVVAGLLGLVLTRVHRRFTSLQWTIFAVAVAAVTVAAAVVGISAGTMILSSPDLKVVLAALSLGTGLGVIVAIGVTGPLTSDLRRLADAAQTVADGDLEVRTAIERRDEVGELARSLDRMVEQLARYQRDRERSEEARRRLLASVSHDLRTPLASLRAAIESIEDGVTPDPARYLRSMAADVELLRSMVDDLFVLTRIAAGDAELERLPVDLSEIVDGTVEAVAPLAASHGVEVALRGDGPVPATVDPRAMGRVLRNLLDNAVRHAPGGSAVRVELSTNGCRARIAVHDEGPGFPPGFADVAFEAFSRADEARERHTGGSGLGLAIAKELVAAHGGSIRIEPGPGGTVGVELPLLDPGTVEPSLTRPGPRPPRAPGPG